MIATAIILAVMVVTSFAGPSNIVRPCNVGDNKCVGDNLAANSRCNPHVRGSVPAEYKIRRFTFDTPFFNATYIDNDLVIKNHNNCFVSEFFFNVASQTAVLSLDCPALYFQSRRTLLQHHSYLEDVPYSFDFKGTYPLVRLTLNLPHAAQLDLCSALAHADVPELPDFHISANDVKTSDYLSRDFSLVSVYEVETFYFRANQLARLYINSLICDFGCDY